MSTTESKAVITVTADTKQAVTEINKLAQATEKQTDTLKKQAAGTNELGKKWEELSKSMVGLQLHDAFKRVSTGVSEATNGVVDLNMAFAGFKVAGPWGAAVGAVGVAAFKAAEQFSLMKGRLGELVEEAKIAADPGGRIPQLTAALYAQEAAILRQNRAWEQLPGILAMVNAGFGQTYKALGQARKDIADYEADMAKTGRVALFNATGKAQDAVQRHGRGGEESAASRAARLRGSLGDRYTDWTDYSGGSSGGGAFASENLDEFGRASTGLQDQVNAMGAAFDSERGSRESRYADFAGGQQSSFLEKTFGPVDQFDLYAQGFQMLSGAVGASLGAWIDGSASAGEAFKKFIGEALKGIAVQMAMEALKHGAYALGSLAFGNVAGAQMHGEAALMFGTGAALAAGAAKAFHSGGASPSTGGGRASPGAPNVSGGGASQPAGRNITIVYGDSLAEDNPHSQRQRSERIVERAYGSTAVEHR